ncbi:MAG: KTSC domain-containing protein, partial [Propionicimonas sp.]
MQTLSAFHVLRAEGRDLKAPGADEWRAWVAQERSFVEYHPNISEARRTSLLRRFLSAADGEVPDGPTWNALQGIRSLTQVHTRELSTHLALFSARTGTTPEAVQARFDELAASVDTSRDAPVPAEVTRERVDKCRRAQLPADRVSVYALTVLDQETASTGTAPRRVVLQPVESTAIAQVGWDPSGGRLEVVFHSNPDRIHGYRNVPESVYQEMMSGSAGQAWNRHIRNSDDMHYRNVAEAEGDAFQSRCTGCGRFAGRAGHLCPAVMAQQVAARNGAAGAVPTPPPLRRPPVVAEPAAAPAEVAPEDEGIARFLPDRSSFQSIVDDNHGVTVRVPGLRVLRPELAAGPVATPYYHFGVQGETHGAVSTYTVVGNLIFTPEADGTVGVSARQLRCACFEYRRDGECAHTRFHQDAVRRAMNPAMARLEDVVAAQADAEAALRADWTRSVDSAQEARDRWVDSDEGDSYGQNFLAFNEDVLAVAARQQAGHSPVPYMTENATDGTCAPGGRAFGVEIEFDFPDTMDTTAKDAALAEIGTDLYRAGLTPTPRQGDYHDAEERGYTEDHEGGWSYEQDCTVSGEIVSP